MLVLSMCVKAAETPTALSDMYQIYVTADENGQVGKTATLTLNMKNRNYISSWVCTLDLPEGVNYQSTTLLPNRYPDNYNASLLSTVNENGSVTIVCSPGSLDDEEVPAIEGADGAVAYVTVDIASSVAPGNYIVSVTNTTLVEYIGGDPEYHTDGSRKFEWTIEEAPLEQFTVYYSGEGVSVSNDRPYYGESVEITVNEVPGYAFESLWVNGTDVTIRMTDNTYTIPFVDSDIYVNAVYRPLYQTITVGQQFVPYCSEWPLDFTNSELKAYIVYGYNKATNCVLLNEVTLVPRFTPVLLKGEVGTVYKINIPATQPSVLYTSLLMESIQGLRIDTYPEIYTTTEVYYDYTRMNYIYDESDGTPGFIPAPESTFIPANSAYLQLPNYSLNQTSESSTGKVYIYLEDDVIVGVDGIEANKGNSSIYDLSGRRLSKPGKGINIVGGKKIAVK